MACREAERSPRGMSPAPWCGFNGQGMSWNHFNAASPTQNLPGYALGMLQSGASSDLAVLYHVVRQETAGRDGGIVPDDFTGIFTVYVGGSFSAGGGAHLVFGYAWVQELVVYPNFLGPIIPPPTRAFR